MKEQPENLKEHAVQYMSNTTELPEKVERIGKCIIPGEC